MKTKNNEKEIAEALYVLNKHVKKLRDNREKLKVKLFEDWEDWGSSGKSAELFLEDWKNGCEEELTEEDEEFEPGNIIYCDYWNPCNYCKENVEELEFEIQDAHNELGELRDKIEDLYEYKESLIKKLKLKAVGYHEFADCYRSYYEWHGFSYHGAEYNDDDGDLLCLGEIDELISSSIKKSKMKIDTALAILSKIKKLS